MNCLKSKKVCLCEYVSVKTRKREKSVLQNSERRIYIYNNNKLEQHKNHY